MSYLKQLIDNLSYIEEKDRDHLLHLAGQIADRLERGGIIQLFGSGHSSLLAQEPYYRAGGLVPVKPVLVDELLLHNGALQSSERERDPAFGDTFIKDLDIREEDVVIVISTSGRNPVPIEVTLEANRRGAFTIGLQSLSYQETQSSRHESGKRLEEVVDAVLDTRVPVGDAILQEEGIDQPFGPTSTAVGAALIHEVFTRVVVEMKKRGNTPPIFKSGNVEGASDHNERLIEVYRERIDF
ncbi:MULTISPECIES: sugar isomerase domain-containing protein [Pontibacillus]|uniref:SIS domain-containing protein n=1 Tax=Pontibacillus chungwhensis TaxID=265426 RepID=A0ABY8UVA0_9BACI|nr:MULTISPECIES: SIS domain-containing protein [Pontibacillus]MCD5325881.1 SIS domain-containing protein [Pontibacillus sp. HN14]WIF97592.1 SIS domain-containing protein [Pontibacillus chungwhensis]